MVNKFNPEDLKKPLYEYSQVITVNDLQIIYRGLVVQLHTSKWWDFRRRYHIKIGGRAVYELLSWLHDGKPELWDRGEK